MALSNTGPNRTKRTVRSQPTKPPRTCAPCIAVSKKKKLPAGLPIGVMWFAWRACQLQNWHPMNANPKKPPITKNLRVVNGRPALFAPCNIKLVANNKMVLSQHCQGITIGDQSLPSIRITYAAMNKVNNAVATPIKTHSATLTAAIVDGRVILARIVIRPESRLVTFNV